MLNVKKTLTKLLGVVGSCSYSLSEVNTGTTWVDGKSIYKKTLRYNNTTLANNTTINHGISNIYRVVKIEAHIDDNGYHLAFPTTANGSPNDLGIRVTATQIQFVGNDSWGAGATRYIYVTLYYTKS